MADISSYAFIHYMFAFGMKKEILTMSNINPLKLMPNSSHSFIHSFIKFSFWIRKHIVYKKVIYFIFSSYNYNIFTAPINQRFFYSNLKKHSFTIFLNWKTTSRAWDEKMFGVNKFIKMKIVLDFSKIYRNFIKNCNA